jgi:hypothetical protein
MLNFMVSSPFESAPKDKPKPVCRHCFGARKLTSIDSNYAQTCPNCFGTGIELSAMPHDPRREYRFCYRIARARTNRDTFISATLRSKRTKMIAHLWEARGYMNFIWNEQHPTSDKQDLCNALINAGQNFERASLARDFDRMIGWEKVINELSAKAESMGEWPSPWIVRGQNMVRYFRDLELLHA